MKFNLEEDKLLFLMELSQTSTMAELDGKLDDWEPSSEMVHQFIKKRATARKMHKDYRKVHAAKAGWRRGRWAHMRGIDKFHKSASGKRFHRALGNFLATRMMHGEDYVDPEYIVAASSLKTHLYLEMLAYQPIHQELELVELLESVVPIIQDFENVLFEAFMDARTVGELELNEDVENMLLGLIETSALARSLAAKVDLSVGDVLKIIEAACKTAVEQEAKSQDPNFWKAVSSILTKTLKQQR